ncbi:MAG TPA: radical SAM protein [Candidatus Paceibacterota bacterium]|nr:radical SAM protein [Candidatus Paceibacterota bacterium]
MSLKILFVELGTALEMGIPPNLAILIGEVKQNNFDVDLFSINEYQYEEKQGDETRVETLQLPPTDKKSSEVKIEYKKGNVIEDFNKKIKDYSPDMIAFSITEISYLKCMDLINSIENNEAYIIVGGVFCILNPEKVIKNKKINAICVGEGEKRFVELCKLIRDNKINYNIENFWFNKGSEVIKNPVSPLTDMNDIVFQDWSCWEPPRSYKIMNGKIRRTAQIELSRGCHHNCTFCANSILNSIFKKNYRERTIDNFISEVNHLNDKYKLNFIYIVDENFLATSKKRFDEFIEKYRKINIPFWIETRPELVTTKKIKALKEVGMEVINIGVEQGDDDFRKRILNRRVKNKYVIRSVKICKQEGVRIGANVIIGFPTETRENIFSTINLIKKAGADFSIMHLFQPYTKTVLRQKSLDMGLISEDYIGADHRLNGIPTGSLSVEELWGLFRTFALYVDLPKERWNEIKKAEILNEEGNKIFRKLAKNYQLKHFGVTSF